MDKGNSESVRRTAERRYVSGRNERDSRIRIRLGDLEEVLIAEGFPRRHLNQICTSLESKKFWGPRGLKLQTPKGQPPRVDTVLEFRVLEPGRRVSITPKSEQDPLLELVGVLKGAIHEGADAFVRELRRDKEVTR